MLGCFSFGGFHHFSLNPPHHVVASWEMWETDSHPCLPCPPFFAFPEFAASIGADASFLAHVAVHTAENEPSNVPSVEQQERHLIYFEIDKPIVFITIGLSSAVGGKSAQRR